LTKPSNYINEATMRVYMTEEELYVTAGKELFSGMVKQGIMAKALVETNGNANIAAAKYIQLRVMELKTKTEQL
jgi:hypothetical protein